MKWLLFFLVACSRAVPPPPPPPPDLAPARSPLPPSPVVQLAAGWYSFAAQLEDGRIFTWGHYLDAPEQAQPRPVLLPLPGKPASMAGASGHAYFCFTLLDDRVVCRSRLPGMYGVGWGDFWALEEGREPFAGPLRQVAAAERNVCGVTPEGKVRCWGAASHGIIGDPQVDRAIEVGVGSNHVCARRQDGSVWCWGGDEHGQLGDVDYRGREGTLIRKGNELSYIGERIRERPQKVLGLDHVAQLATGSFFNCARKDDGTVWCWGCDTESKLDGRRHWDHSKPLAIASLDDVVELRAGGDAACARKKNGHVSCWGHDQTSDSSSIALTLPPSEVPDLDDARAIAAGTYGGCALRSSGQVACWGSRRFGQLGDGQTSGSARLSTVLW